MTTQPEPAPDEGGTLDVPLFEMPEIEETTVDLRFDDGTPIFNDTMDDLRDQLPLLGGEQSEGSEDETGHDSGEVDQH